VERADPQNPRKFAGEAEKTREKKESCSEI